MSKPVSKVARPAKSLPELWDEFEDRINDMRRLQSRTKDWYRCCGRAGATLKKISDEIQRQRAEECHE